MKKSNIVKIVILMVVVAFLIAIIYVIDQNVNVVDKFSLCTIKTYQGEEITDYKNNKRAFIIEGFDEETIVKVNGKKYEKELGLYKPGTYNVEVKNGNKTEKSKITINKIDESKSNNYNVYMPAETLPTLFSSFDMIKQNNEKSYIWFEREGTLDIEALKEIMPNATISEYIGKDDATEFFPKVRNEVKSFVNEILNTDENAHFTVYVTAECYWLEIATLEELGLTRRQGKCCNVLLWNSRLCC